MNITFHGAARNVTGSKHLLQLNDGTSILKEEYLNPANGLKVVGYTIINGGHTWPGGWQYLPKFIIGKTTKNLNACEEIWGFFKGYKLSVKS